MPLVAAKIPMQKSRLAQIRSKKYRRIEAHACRQWLAGIQSSSVTIFNKQAQLQQAIINASGVQQYS